MKCKTKSSVKNRALSEVAQRAMIRITNGGLAK